MKLKDKLKATWYTLRVRVSQGSGTTSPSGTVSRQEGTSVTITASPSSYYVFDFWLVDGKYKYTRSYTFTMPDYDVTASAYFSKATYTVSTYVSPSGAGYIDGGGTYEYDETCKLRAHDDFPYKFTRWSSGETSKSISFRVTGNTSRTAYYELEKFDVDLYPDDTSHGTVSGSGRYSYGTNVNISATAKTGWKFSHWSDGNTSSSRTIRVTGEIELIAYFERNTHYVSLYPEPLNGGTVIGNGTYTHGTTITIIATPNPHWKFIKWSDGSTLSAREITVVDDIELTAYFKQDDHILFHVSPNGTGDVYRRTSYEDVPISEWYLPYDESVTVFVFDRPGYRFINWNNTELLSNRNLQLDYTSGQTRNYTAYEEYVGFIYLSISVTEGGIGIVDRAVTYDREIVLNYPKTPQKEITTNYTIIDFKAEVNPGYVFDHWELNGVRLTTDAEFERVVYGADNSQQVFTPVFRKAGSTTYTVIVGSNIYPTSGRYGYIKYKRPTDTSWQELILTQRETLTLPQGTHLRIFHSSVINYNGNEYYFVAWSDAKPDNMYGYPAREWKSLDDNITLQMNFNEAVHVHCIAEPDMAYGYFTFTFGTDSHQQGYDYVGGKDQVITIQATPHRGYEFVEWQDTHSPIPLRQLTLNQNVTLVGIFRDTGGEKEYFNVTVDTIPSEGGTVTGAGRYSAGSLVVLRATPNEGFEFERWSIGDTSKILDFRITDDKHFTAYFRGKKPIKPGKMSFMFRKKKKLVSRLIELRIRK